MAREPNYGNRGRAWTDPEVRDLLALWGEPEVQERLRESHRNIEVFVAVAAEMGRRGHSRTGEECRNKTKMMRQQYRRVLEHNRLPGAAPAATCPYYQELQHILGEEASVALKRVPRNPRLLCPFRTPSQPTREGIKVEEEEEEEIGETTSSSSLPISPASVHDSPLVDENDSDATQRSDPQEEGNRAVPLESTHDTTSSTSSTSNTQIDHEQVLSSSQLIPRSCLRMARSRREHERREEAIAIALMEQQAEISRSFQAQNAECIEEMRKGNRIMITIAETMKEDTIRIRDYMAAVMSEMRANRDMLTRMLDSISTPRPDRSNASHILTGLGVMSRDNRNCTLQLGSQVIGDDEGAVEEVPTVPVPDPVCSPESRAQYEVRPKRKAKRQLPYTL